MAGGVFRASKVAEQLAYYIHVSEAVIAEETFDTPHLLGKEYERTTTPPTCTATSSVSQFGTVLESGSCVLMFVLLASGWFSVLDNVIKKVGNIVLHIPKEGLQRSPEEAIKEKKPVQRMENRLLEELLRQSVGHISQVLQKSEVKKIENIVQISKFSSGITENTERLKAGFNL
ncbi:hypothetical protein PFLUV_G00164050 [Perca fluviatilis]|uniref:Uncharacterized protein n=1 Tax=Perca fluviatilis TaxID=8168 RepID=A0A6A5EN77_PERFL|nr:hypothetical protein PFLUV_G00164050 [Perca fluviatilis]